jgi:hypothetical protein
MNTPVIALTTGEAEAIARANAALSWIRADSFPWPVRGSGEIKARADDLRDSLDDYAGLTAGRIHPATLFFDLSRHQDNAMEIALDKVTQDIRERTRALTVLAQEAEDTARAREEEMAA